MSIKPICWHEAGHYICAKLLGHTDDVYAVVGPATDDQGNKVGGLTRYTDPARFALHTQHERRMLAISGCVAEAFANILAGHPPSARWVFSRMSISDWRLCDEDAADPSPGMPDALTSVWRLFEMPEVWVMIMDAARQLDRHGFVAEAGIMEAALAWRAERALTPKNIWRTNL